MAGRESELEIVEHMIRELKAALYLARHRPTQVKTIATMELALGEAEKHRERLLVSQAEKTNR
jgi:hypothetical protein